MTCIGPFRPRHFRREIAKASVRRCASCWPLLSDCAAPDESRVLVFSTWRRTRNTQVSISAGRVSTLRLDRYDPTGSAESPRRRGDRRPRPLHHKETAALPYNRRLQPFTRRRRSAQCGAGYGPCPVIPASRSRAYSQGPQSNRRTASQTPRSDHPLKQRAIWTAWAPGSADAPAPPRHPAAANRWPSPPPAGWCPIYGM